LPSLIHAARNSTGISLVMQLLPRTEWQHLAGHVAGVSTWGPGTGKHTDAVGRPVPAVSIFRCMVFSRWAGTRVMRPCMRTRP
jgi:hypothetical protein